MVKILAGEKGEGKTKRMIDMANAAGKEAKGNIVFVDDDNSHMYDLHYSVRFVETSSLWKIHRYSEALCVVSFLRTAILKPFTLMD